VNNNDLFFLVKDIRKELSNISKITKDIIELYDLIKKNNEVDKFYLSSFGGFLQSYYNGVESIFLRISKVIDGAVPTDKNWHKELLIRINYETDNRPKIINDELFESLSEYSNFRHFFRHTYTFQLKWEKIKPLVKKAKNCCKELSEQIEQYLVILEKSIE